MRHAASCEKRFLLSLIILYFSGIHSLNAQLQADFNPDKAGGCSPLTVSFTDATKGASGSAAYFWDLANGNTSTLKNPGAFYNEEKSYPVTLTVTDSGRTSVKSFTITVYKKPVADFSAEAARVCLPSGATFISAPLPGDDNITDYHWDFGDGFTQQGAAAKVSHVYANIQEATVSLTVTNVHGCSNSITKTKIVQILPAMTAGFTSDKELVCTIADPVQFSNTSTGQGALQYAWDFGDGTTGNQKDPSHVFGKKGLFTISVRVFNADGCTATFSKGPVNVANFNTDFSINPLCRQIDLKSSSFLTPSASLWSFGDNIIDNTQGSVSHTYTTPGDYSVKLVNTYGSCKDSVTKTVTAIEKVDFKSDFTFTGLVCKGKEVKFTPSGANTPTARNWNFANGTTSTAIADASTFYNAPGVYQVKLVNTYGTCTEELTKQVTVHELPDTKPFSIDSYGACGAPSTIKFKDNTPDAVKWDWDLNGLGTGKSTIVNPSFTYPANETYNVGLTVTNAAGCTGFIAATVKTGMPVVQIAPTRTMYHGGVWNCGDFTVKFQAFGSEEIVEFKWDFGDGTSIVTDKEPEHVYEKNGTYDVTLSYVTINGCTGKASYSGINMYEQPTANFTYTLPPCTNSDATIVSLKNTTDMSTELKWSSGTLTSGSATPDFKFADTGYYSIQLIAFNGACFDAVQKTVHADVLPSYATITAYDINCNGLRDTVTFDQRSLRAENLKWNFGDGTTLSTDVNDHAVKHAYLKTGVYNVTLTASNGTCALTNSTNNVKVLIKQKPVLALSKQSICGNEPVMASISGMDMNPFAKNPNNKDHYRIDRFEYEDGSLFTGTASKDFSLNTYSSAISGFKTGDLRIRAIISNIYTGCKDTSNFVSVSAKGPKADFNITNNAACFKSPLTFNDNSSTDNNISITSWSWNFGDGAIEDHTNKNPVQHIYAKPGIYQVTLKLTDAGGCSVTASSAASVMGPIAAFTVTGASVPDVPLSTAITFVNNSSVGFSTNTQYLWQYGDVSTSTGLNGSYRYNVAGTYTVKLIATDPTLPCSDTATYQVNVKSFNTAFKVGQQNLGSSNCPPLKVQLTNLSAGTTRVEWDFGDGSERVNQYNPAHIYNQTGKYIITLYTYGANGLSGTFIDSVFVAQPSGSMATNVNAACSGQQITLTATSTGVEKYLWDMGDGTLRETSSNSYTHTYLAAGIYSPGVLLKDAKGCIGLTTFAGKIIIDSLNISLDQFTTDVCEDAAIQFVPKVYSIAENQGGAVTYQWNFGTGNAADIATGREVSFAYSAPGKYNVKISGLSQYGCLDEDEREITIHSTAPLVLTTDNLVNVCEKKTVVLNVGGASSYEWTNYTQGLSDTRIPNPTVSTLTDATYTVTGFDRYHCASGTAAVNVKVSALPTVNAGEDTEALGNTEVPLQATGSSDIVSWSWSPADYLSCTECQATISKPKKDMLYAVKGVNSYKCESWDTVLVKMLCVEGYIYIPNTFTPNHDGKNDIFYIKGKGIGVIKSLRIFNRWGSTVFEQHNFEIDNRSFGWNGYQNNNPVPPGSYVYIAEMECKSGGTFIKKGTVTVLY